jgi:hypothetical protein
MSTLAAFVARVKKLHNYIKKALHRIKDYATASFAHIRNSMQTVLLSANLSAAT